MIVVSDTSPLNYLILIGQVDVLPATLPFEELLKQDEKRKTEGAGRKDSTP